MPDARLHELLSSHKPSDAMPGVADAIVVEALAKRYRERNRGGARRLVPRRRRRDLRHPRPQRRRQVDHDGHARHARAADRRPGDRRRVTTSSTHPREVRRRIGFAMQEVGVDELATGSELLVLHGRLHGLSRREARRRAGVLLELVGLDDAADDADGRVLGRHAAAGRPRLGADPPAAGAVPRRADRGPGPARPRRDLGDARAAERRCSA